MLRILSLPDLHGSLSALRKAATAAPPADVVVLAGDVAEAGPSLLRRVVAEARSLAPVVLAVPGNMDGHEVLAEMVRLDLSLHGRCRVVEGVAFLGAGGALPFYGPMELDESELAACLEEAATRLPEGAPSVLVCHQPPHGTAADRIRTGAHVGSRSVRTFIEARAPLLALTGHIHEAVADEDLGPTRLLNPGPFARTGLVAYAEIDEGRLGRAELVRLA